ncbi:MAG: hypothetical protein ABIP61_05965 [Burkholderiaceae bacterium]
MLRALVLLLVLANGAFYAWTQGWLDEAVGVRAIGDREPERLARQVRPELVRILPPDAATSSTRAAEAEPNPLACLEAGPFGDAEVAAAEAALQAAAPHLANGRWARIETSQPGAWIVYMGRYASRDALAKKEDELRRREVAFEELRDTPALEPGLVLGRFNQRAQADAALARLVQQDIHTARVTQLAPAASTFMLRVAQADSTLAARLSTLKVGVLGRGFAACTKASGG